MQIIDLGNAMNPKPLMVRVEIDNLHEANRHRLVQWLRDWAQDIETRDVSNIPVKIRASL